MLVIDHPSSTHQVRCRQIEEGDLDALATMFQEGFVPSRREFWANGLANMAAMTPVEGIPRFGYLLESPEGFVGGLLTLSSRRGDQVISNVSAWYVQESYRAYSTFLVSVATRFKHVIYLNASPAHHTWRNLELTGWKLYNFGRSAAFPQMGRPFGRVSETIPDHLPERKLLEDHRALDCISVVCEKDGAISPFVFKRRRWSRLNLPMMELIYCRGTREFEKYGAALGRFLSMRKLDAPLRKRVSFGFLLDGKVEHMPSYYQEGKQPRFYKGPRAPEINDLAYTEKAIFE